MSSQPPEAATLTSLSRILSKVLRHEPELVGAKLDDHGWIGIEALVRCINRSAGQSSVSKRLRTLGQVTPELVLLATRESSKQRFSISEDGRRIRAAQGHSIDVDLQYLASKPPDVLYHGTAAATWPLIDGLGLLPMGRLHVHLSIDMPTALNVGMRHGRPLVLEIAAGPMQLEGSKFYLADNGVWLTQDVPRRFITRSGGAA